MAGRLAAANLHYVITGASRGIGLEFVRQLLERNSTSLVAACCREPSRAKDLEAIQAKHPGRLHVVELDVTNDEEVLQLPSRLPTSFAGRVDVLINNAGILFSENSIADVTRQHMEETFQTNVVSPLFVTRALLPLLGAKSLVMNISSMMGSIQDNSSGGYYSYRMSKTALNMVNKSLAIDLKGQGVICVVVHPGWVKTDMGGPKAHLEAADSVAGLLSHVVDKADISMSGKFIKYDGKEISW